MVVKYQQPLPGTATPEDTHEDVHITGASIGPSSYPIEESCKRYHDHLDTYSGKLPAFLITGAIFSVSCASQQPLCLHHEPLNLRLSRPGAGIPTHRETRQCAVPTYRRQVYVARNLNQSLTLQFTKLSSPSRV